MDWEKFKLARNVLQKQKKPEAKKGPINRALVIGYYDPDMPEHIKAYRDRYKSESYKVKTLFLSNEDINKIRKRGEQVGDSNKSQELKDAIEWLKQSDNSLLSFNHHGYENIETPNIIKGVTTAKILSKHGLSGDLNKMEIRYEPCYGAKKEAWLFFSKLMNNGASNFLGDAKTVANTTVVMGAKAINIEKQEKKISNIKKKIDKLQNQNDTANGKPIKKNKIDKIDKLKKKEHEESDKLNYRHVPLKRGDSLAEFVDENNLEKSNLPRVKDEKGKFKYNRYYICREKKGNEKSKLIWTATQSVVEKFKNMDIRFNNDRDKLTEGNDSQKVGKRSSPRMR